MIGCAKPVGQLALQFQASLSAEQVRPSRVGCVHDANTAQLGPDSADPRPPKYPRSSPMQRTLWIKLSGTPSRRRVRAAAGVKACCSPSVTWRAAAGGEAGCLPSLHRPQAYRTRPQPAAGTNAADIGVVHICNGLLNNNETLVATAFAKIYSTFQYSYSEPPTNPEGPKPDGSFMQHGPQLYNGNYGASWTKSGLLLIAVAAGTVYNATGAGYDAVAHVTLDGCANMIHYPSLQWDVSVIGRQVRG
jgi:hypothetical protein